MLEIKDGRLSAGERLLFSNLSLRIDNGSICCLMGESGCGKTSLLKAVMGFHQLNEGVISIDGELLTPSSAESFRKSTAYLPQELSLPTEWVSEMVSMPFSLKQNKSVSFSTDLLFHEWELLGLSPHLYEKKVRELSGGERQRIMLSLCGMLSKTLILADEPTSALDSESTLRVASYLRRQADRGAAILVVSHDRDFSRQCDTIVTLVPDTPPTV